MCLCVLSHFADKMSLYLQMNNFLNIMDTKTPRRTNINQNTSKAQRGARTAHYCRTQATVAGWDRADLWGWSCPNLHPSQRIVTRCVSFSIENFKLN